MSQYQKLKFGGVEKRTRNIPMRVVLSDKDVKAIEDDDQGKVGEGKPGSVWLETTPEHKCVAVDALSFERLVEMDVCDTNRAPSKERGDSGQILEPSKDS